MISASYCTLFARYNRWMNRKVYAACEALSDAERKRDRGAFFGSVHSTLNHLLYADLAFLSRFTGDPEEVPPLGVDLFDTLAALTGARTEIDERLIAWADGVDEPWLGRELTYTSKVDGVTRTRAHWEMVAHWFNHQTHHRGQVTTLLSQREIDIGSTDLPFMPQA